LDTPDDRKQSYQKRCFDTGLIAWPEPVGTRTFPVGAFIKHVDYIQLRRDRGVGVERRQEIKFALMPNGEQQRTMRRFALRVRYIYNHALHLLSVLRFALNERAQTCRPGS
jgi:hypothetical protein